MNEIKQCIPEGHDMQIASLSFKFDIITSSRYFKNLLDTAIKNDYVRDLCHSDLGDLTQDEIKEIKYPMYINVPQKSSTWFFLREKADGTASSVGKYIRGPKAYPTIKQTLSHWEDKINKKPFEKTHTMTGHMNWGVGYEDPALIHFADHLGVCVSQVGTIRVELKLILDIGKLIFKDNLPDLTNLVVNGKHLLVSPDGLVSKPVKKNESEFGYAKTDMPKMKDLLGMLEIKCISPFYHIETDDKFLEWVDDMETRQWWKPEDIPFVYIIQMCMQALSGAARFKMNGAKEMWFIRWSPHGVSIFKMQFKYLIRLGVPAALHYFSLIQRVKRLDQIDGMFDYSENGNGTQTEKKLNQMISVNYRILMKNTTHTYHEIDKYPEFDIYNEVTQYFKFKVPEIDPETLQVIIPKEEPGEYVNASDLQNCVF